METPAGWERTKRIVDLVAGLSVIATMVFIALQWNEMRAGGADTHDLAVAAKAQADAAKIQADNTKTLAQAAIEQVTKLDAGVKESHELARLAQQTLMETRANFVKDQRPYMWAKPLDVKLEEGKRIFWDIHFINYGKSPAVDLHTCIVLFYGMNILPDMTEEGRDSRCRKLPPNPSSIAIAPPGDNIFTTAASDGILSAEAIAALRDVDYRIGLMGKIQYKDMGGKMYVSTFCAMHLAAGGTQSCGEYNEIK